MSPGVQTEMHLMDHLGELRRRLVYSAVAILAGAVIAYFYTTEVFDLLSRPYYRAFAQNLLIGTGPAEAFVLKLKVAFFAGLILACPILFYQVWCFIAPGLYESEKKLVGPFVASTTILFLTGVYFSYNFIFPVAFTFFHEQYVSIGVTPTIKMSEHLGMMIQGLLAFGIVFQMPVLAFFLGRLGVIDHHFLIRSTRYAVVIIFVISAILTPPDVMSQFLMAGPLCLLYGLSILVVKLSQRDSSVTDLSVAPFPGPDKPSSTKNS